MLKRMSFVLLIISGVLDVSLFGQKYTIIQNNSGTETSFSISESEQMIMRSNDLDKISLSITGNPSAGDIINIIKEAVSHIDEQEAAVLFAQLNRNMLNNISIKMAEKLQQDLVNNVSLDQSYFIENLGIVMKNMTDAGLEVCLEAGILQHALPLEVVQNVNNNTITCAQTFMTDLCNEITEKISTLDLDNVDDKKIYLEFMAQVFNDYLLKIASVQENTLAQFYPEAFLIKA